MLPGCVPVLDASLTAGGICVARKSKHCLLAPPSAEVILFPACHVDSVGPMFISLCWIRWWRCCAMQLIHFRVAAVALPLCASHNDCAHFSHEAAGLGSGGVSWRLAHARSVCKCKEPSDDAPAPVIEVGDRTESLARLNPARPVVRSVRTCACS